MLLGRCTEFVICTVSGIYICIVEIMIGIFRLSWLLRDSMGVNVTFCLQIVVASYTMHFASTHDTM
ncbi:hypothetical protein V1523DRAFT_414886 [Lipomyces doorenjongii]